MSVYSLKTDPEVKEVFEAYPEYVKNQMYFLRELILETAAESPGVSTVEESLKWGEPAYRSNIGSTLRIDWKEKSPDHYAMYFQCSSSLVDSFRFVYGQLFLYEGKRAIIFQLNQKLPLPELKECIKAALCYHKVKHLKTLGMEYSV